MPTHPDGQHGKNSQIQAKGIGKNSKRHDLDGTPGLSPGSSLIQGQVQQFEAGQKAVDNTQRTQGGGGQPLPQQPQEAAVIPPAPLDMAKSRLGGGLQVPTRELNAINTAQWLPLIQKLAESNGASSLLRRAYVQMFARLQNEPFSGSTAVVDKNALDDAVNDEF